MGATRKTLSIFTLGLIDFWSDRERVARNTAATKRAAREQAKTLAKIEKQGRLR